VVVRVVDCIEKLAGLGKEGSDFAITPAGQNALAVCHKTDSVALKAWDLDS